MQGGARSRRVSLFRLALRFAVLLVVAGCASTEITSFIDPGYGSRGKFASVMVLGDRMSLKERQLAENTLVQEFSKYGVRALRGIDYVPPTRNLTNEELSLAIQSSGVNTILILALVDQDTIDTYVPPIYHPGRSRSKVSMVGNTGYVETRTSPGYVTGGFNVSKPLAAYKTVLIDTANGQTIWTAEAISRGSKFNSFEDLTASASEETVLKLIADGLF